MNSDQYAQEIQQTREDIDRTLNTLEDKLSLPELWEQALKWSDGAKEFSVNLARTVIENPIPAILMGISVLWLMTAGSARRTDSGDRYENFGRMRSGLPDIYEEPPPPIALQTGSTVRTRAGAGTGSTYQAAEFTE